MIVLEHLTEAQRRAYVLADNKLALNAGWDEALLRLELAYLSELGFDLDLVGFGEGELERLLAGTKEGLTDDDDAPAQPEQAITQPGDLWLLGDHRLLCGDATYGGRRRSWAGAGRHGLHGPALQRRLRQRPRTRCGQEAEDRNDALGGRFHGSCATPAPTSWR